MQYYFETRNLTVGYQNTPLIQNISFGLAQGEILTLIGPNGSGKTTILKNITKHLEPLSGTVYIGQDELGHITYKDLSQKLAVVLTERILPELMRCWDVVASGRYPYTGRLGLLSKEDERIVTEAMEVVDALELGSQDFRTISDGQRQRILLARAICQQPEVIVLDEPTSFLDIRHKVELLNILRNMAKERKTTVIMSLHEIDLAQKVSDKILCVKGEHMSHFGTPEEIFQPEIIHELYDIPEGVFNIKYGSIEMPPQTGEARIFVISSCGSGIAAFRKLQRMGIPFYAGILYTNDIDYQVAKALAAEVVTEQPFESIGEDAVQRAKEFIKMCSRVMICNPVIGTGNKRLLELIEFAQQTGKEIVREWG